MFYSLGGIHQAMISAATEFSFQPPFISFDDTKIRETESFLLFKKKLERMP